MSAVRLALAVAAAVLLQGSMTLRTVARGDQSNVDSPRQVVARTASEWNALWRQHDFDRPAPAVDLSREMIVAVFLGSRTTAGFGVEIASAQSQGGGVLVRYKVSEPGAGSVTAQVLTFPYHIVALPRSAGDVKFDRID